MSSFCNRASEFQSWCTSGGYQGYSSEFCDCSIPIGTDQCQGPSSGCPYDGTWFQDECSCTHGMDPMVIDVLGDGFAMTNRAWGVDFDMDADGRPDRLSWTKGSSDDSFLVLDRNGNAVVDDGSELFGNATPQSNPPLGSDRNGFRALSEFDQLENGGNANGKISGADAIFASLRLWQDSNHNGYSEADELESLSEYGITSIELNYKLSKKIDESGNKFRYRTKVNSEKKSRTNRWAWDVKSNSRADTGQPKSGENARS